MTEETETPKEENKVRICPFCLDVVMYCECQRNDPTWSNKEPEEES